MTYVLFFRTGFENRTNFKLIFIHHLRSTSGMLFRGNFLTLLVICLGLLMFGISMFFPFLFSDWLRIRWIGLSRDIVATAGMITTTLAELISIIRCCIEAPKKCLKFKNLTGIKKKPKYYSNMKLKNYFYLP